VYVGNIDLNARIIILQTMKAL